MSIRAFLLLLLSLPARATYTLTVSTSGPFDSNVVVTSTPSGIVCPGTCAAVFAASTTVTLGEVNPSSIAFVNWGGDQGCRTNQPTCVLTLRADSLVTAFFDPLLAVSVAGKGVGFVVGPSTSQIFGQAGNYNNTGTQLYISTKGATIVLKASTGPASAFVGWSGDPGCSTASTCTITLNGYESITATFTVSGTTIPLAVVVVPAGGGTVTSSPPGLACTGGICSANFQLNTVVSLATAAAAGYRFAGWANGGCSGLTPCVVTSTSPLQGLGGSQSPAAFFFKQ